MAAADYCLCFRCGKKAFYDAEVTDERYTNAFDWNFEGARPPRHIEMVGIKVICVECNRTHEVIIRERNATQPATSVENISAEPEAETPRFPFRY